MGNTVLSIEGNLSTNFSGIKRLFEFYHEAKVYTNTTISIDFYRLNWIDANLCALLHGILYKLSVDNNLKFSTDMVFLEEQFNVLFRNGFINSGSNVDERNSVITLKEFNSKDKDGFINYIENELLCNRGMPQFSIVQKDEIVNALIELFNNIDRHAQTSFPFFVCGQYFPTKMKVVFSMVDLGVGFLPAIREKTNGGIDCSIGSIKWALIKKHTTKKCCPGGLGLSDLHDYCLGNNGILQIITGDAYWSSDLLTTNVDHLLFSKPFVGSIINLHFNCN